MMEIPVRLFRVTVVFNPLNIGGPRGPITLLSDDFYIDQALDSGHPLSLPQGISLIAFDLMTLPGTPPGGDPARQANFDETAPITWPSGPSPALLVQPYKPTHCVIVDFNTDKVVNEHPFVVNVMYDESPFPSDPIIVNEPPMPVG